MKVIPAKPATRIPALLTKPLTSNQHQAAAKIFDFFNSLEKQELVPTHELTLRWRVEIAAAFLATVIGLAKAAARDGGESQPEIADFFLNVAIERAREIDAQGHA
jgi:hypothetical protein